MSILLLNNKPDILHYGETQNVRTNLRPWFKLVLLHDWCTLYYGTMCLDDF